MRNLNTDYPTLLGFPAGYALKRIVPLAVLLAAMAGSFYTVSPTDMAGVRRLGTVVTAQPVGPGLHFKIPFIDKVDRLQVSLQSVEQMMQVHTVDNQKIDLDVKVFYTVPPEAVLPLLYKVGRAGNADIQDQIRSLLADRTGKIFAQQNVNNVSLERQHISDEIEAVTAKDLATLYGVAVKDYQITKMGFSEAFNTSIEEMTRSKTAVLAAQNKEAEIKAIGEQKKITADADAYQTKVAADAAAYSSEKNADAEAYGTQKQGEAQAGAVKVQRAMFASDQAYVDYLRARQWNGAMPSTYVATGTGGGFGALVNIPAQKQ